MAKKLPTWVIGCGIGCGALLLVVIVVTALGAAWLRETVSGMERAVVARDALEERYGDPGAFTPPPDGRIPPDRVEVFLSLRETLAPQRQAVGALFAELPLTVEEARAFEEKPFFEKLGAVFSISKTAMGFGKTLGSFFETRNTALLDADLSMGEYTYIYYLAYYQMLDHSPDDGPDSNPSADEPDFRMSGAVTTSSRIRANLRNMLLNQLAALPADADEPWRSTLEAEARRLQDDERRIPWQEGLPDRILASLEPYRDALEASYDPVTNPFELARNRKRGRFSYTSD